MKEVNKKGKGMGHEEMYNLLVSRELSWQQIIYDLIKSEQLDPWDIDLSQLTQKYLAKVQEMEEANFIISAKILLAASLLLRIKSELLINKYIKSLDEVLFGKPEKKEVPPLNIDLDDVSELFPRTPLPRPRRVTLNELIGALNRAMVTEHRRIKNEISVKHALNRFNFFLPKSSTDVRFKIKEIYEKIKGFFSKGNQEKMTFSLLAPTNEEKRMSFAPILHLDHQNKVTLDQLKHFEEIFIYMKDIRGSADDLIKELKARENEYVEEKMKEQVEEEMHNKFEEINQIKEEANKPLTEDDF